MTNDSRTNRIHALDSLRAIMMLLGIVVHSALTYGVVDYKGDWGLKDKLNTNIFFDHLVHFIHVFRMPLFFVMAGFFGALLFYEKGPLKMIRNRVDRILLPFVVFISFIFPLSLTSFIFTQNKIRGNPDAARAAAEWLLGLKLSYYSTVHLWFLYYLAMFSFAGWALGLLFTRVPTVTRQVNLLFGKIVSHVLPRTLFLSLMTYFCLHVMGTAGIKTSISFKPDASVFLIYFLIYLFGWLLFKSKDLLPTLSRWGWLQIAAGLIFFMMKTLMLSQKSDTFFHLRQFANATSCWFFIFGFTALFLTYFKQKSAPMRYISDASYWVYLIHLPIVSLIPGYLAGLDMSPFIKFTIVLSLTTGICFLTYHWFVRSTFIGKFLSGGRIRVGHAKELP